MTDFKPDGYPAISPYAVLDDPKASLSFIEGVFGGKRLRIIEDDEGRIRHAEIRIGETVLMMGQSSAEWPSTDTFLHFYIPDVDDIWQRALSMGATGVQKPMDRDGDYRGGFRDPGGLTWWIARAASNPDPKEHD